MRLQEIRKCNGREFISDEDIKFKTNINSIDLKHRNKWDKFFKD